MTPNEQKQQEQIDILCAQIATEQDQEKFVKLVQELNDLLDRKNLNRQNLDRKNPDRNNLDRKNDLKNPRIDPPASGAGSTSVP